MGGLHFPCFTKLFDSLVLRIITYAAAVWGNRIDYCVNSVFNRACRFYHGFDTFMPMRCGLENSFGITHGYVFYIIDRDYAACQMNIYVSSYFYGLVMLQLQQ